MKNVYEKAFIEVIKFEAKDIITTSGNDIQIDEPVNDIF